MLLFGNMTVKQFLAFLLIISVIFCVFRLGFPGVETFLTHQNVPNSHIYVQLMKQHIIP